LGKKIIGVLLIAILTIVLTASLSYVFSQPNQNIPSATTTPTPTPTPSPTPTSTPSEEPNETDVYTKPSVPEFILELADHSYDVPPVTTTAIDEYTGKEIVTTTPGYHVENKIIDIIITNQPFVPTESPAIKINLYYDVRIKGHFGDNWRELHIHTGNENDLPVQSTSEYTIVWVSQDFPSDSKVDFQVRAVRGADIALYSPSYDTPFGYWTYETSDWSNTQTITLP